MRTNTRVQFGLYDVTAKGDSQPACAAAQPFCCIQQDLLLEQPPQQVKYGTLESGQFWMDGSYALFPDQPAGKFWGLWSRQQSGPDGRFENPPVLTVSFSQPHSSAGLTFHFYQPTGDWASELGIEWFGASGELLRAARFAPDGVDHYCACKVEGYRQVRIRFFATNRPGRYLKLAGLDYGAALTFSGPEVVEAHILEETDLVSSEVSVNTLQLQLYNREGKFSILNPGGVFDVLQHKQKFTVYEELRAGPDVPPVSYNMGTFYLSEWENTSDTLARFTAVDAVGLLDSAPFDGGVYNTTGGALAAGILSGYEYWLDPALAARPVQGHLPIGTRRSALQQLAFALGAVVDCSRGDAIRIYPPPARPSGLIPHSRKFLGGKVSLRPLITGVQVTGHQYLQGSTTEELFRDTLAAGQHRITLDAPAAGLAVTGGSLLEAGSNHAVVSVPAAGEVVLTGKKYQENKTTALCRPGDLPANAAENILTVDGATLVGPQDAPAAARRVLEHYARRYEMSFELLAGEERLADMLIVESFGGERVRGVLEKMEFDLTGGFRASVRVVGQRLNTRAPAYAGEIFTGERSLL